MKHSLNIPTAAAPSTGTAMNTRDFTDIWAMLGGDFSAGAFVLQGSMNGDEFFDLSSGSKNQTNKGLFQVVERVEFIRVSKTVDFVAEVTLDLSVSNAK